MLNPMSATASANYYFLSLIEFDTLRPTIFDKKTKQYFRKLNYIYIFNPIIPLVC